MRIRLEALLSALTSLGAVAYTLGWLKSLYFYRTLGVSLDLADLSSQDYLFESWFVLENVAFFLLLWWIVQTKPAWWMILIGVLYSLVPVASHYAFVVRGWPTDLLIAYRHTILKLVPFVVLAIALVDRKARQRLRELTWRHGTGWAALAALAAVAWSISAAKHFGSFDAIQILERPDDYLTRVVVRPGDTLKEWDESQRCYLLRATDDTYILLNLTTFDGRPGSNLGVVVVPRSSVRLLDGVMKFQHQIGGRYF